MIKEPSVQVAKSTQPPKNALAQFVTDRIPSGGQSDYQFLEESQDSVLGAIAELVEDNQRAISLVALNFWQAYVNSAAFNRELINHGLPVASPSELIDGWFAAARDRVDRTSRLPQMWRAGALDLQERFQLTPQAAIEASRRLPFCMVVSGYFEEDLTMWPSPPLVVAAKTSRSSAGVFVRDEQRRIGVTAAGHAVPPRSKVKVGDRPSIVLHRDDRFTDSCVLSAQYLEPRGFRLPGVTSARAATT